MERPKLQLIPEATPNPQALKLLFNYRLLENGTFSFKNREEAEHSALAARLFELQAVQEVLISAAFVTINKAEEIEWQTLLPAAANQIQIFHDSGLPAVDPAWQAKAEFQSRVKRFAYGEIEKQILRVLEEEIRPEITKDGGDITFYGFEDGVVKLHMQGACHSCPSSALTLKATIERRLKAALPEVTQVIQV